MDLKGTKTEQNLRAAFSGESEARNKYTYFASVAKKEGYEQISAIFLDTANNEKEHAKMWFKELKALGNTAENLKAAAEGENYEWTDMYDGFAKTAVWWRQLRKPTKKDTLNFLIMLKCKRYLKRLRKPCGNAVTAVTW